MPKKEAHTKLVETLLYHALETRPSNPLKEEAFRVAPLRSHPMVTKALPKCPNLKQRLNLN